MISIKRSISFAVETKNKQASATNKAKAADGRLRCIVTWQGQRVRLSVNHSVNPDYWERALQRCRAKSVHGKIKTPASVINRDIEDLEILINGIFASYEEKDRIPSKDEFLQDYERLTAPVEEVKEEPQPATDNSIFPIFDKYIEDNTRNGRWSESALKKNRTIRKHLYDMSSKVTFEELEATGMSDFIAYLSSIPDKEKRVGLSNPTIKKDIGFVKAFVRWAQEKGYVGHNKFLIQKVRLKTAKKPVIFLSWDELMTVYNYDFGNLKYLSQVRDVFCFCCFTSLRYSDVHNLRKSNFNGTSFTFTTMKTNDTLTIELNKYSKAILDKYAHVNFPDDKVLPVISNQKMNDYLKEIGKRCGIDAPVTLTIYKGMQRIDETHPKWELLSTHAGRRTFVCNAIMLGIPPTIVMKWTGHSDYRAMKPYIDIIDDAAKKAMGAFDKAETDIEKVGQKVGQKFEVD